MKIKLTRLTTETVEMELPDECPHCGELWRGHGLTEMQLLHATRDGTGLAGEKWSLPLFDSYDPTDVDPHGYVEGYSCVACADVIVWTGAS